MEHGEVPNFFFFAIKCDKMVLLMHFGCALHVFKLLPVAGEDRYNKTKRYNNSIANKKKSEKYIHWSTVQFLYFLQISK